MMKFLSLPLFFAFLLLQMAKVYALGLDEIRQMEVSSAGKTIMVDRGVLDNYAEGTTGKFFIQTGDFEFPKIFLIAEGKIVKSEPKYSIWYMTKVYDSRFIVKDGNLLALTDKAVNTGRTIKVKQKHIVVSPNEYQNVDQYLDENKNNVPDRLLQASQSFEESPELYETNKTPEADVVVKTYEQMRKNSGKTFSDQYNDETEEKYFIGNREVSVADIKNAENKKLLDSIASGYVEKINGQKFKLSNGLYKNQQKVPGSRELNNKISIASVYDTVQEDKKKRDMVSSEAMAKMKRDGEHWSEDMDDATLRRYFIRTGLEQEKRRRELALNELDGHEMTFHYSGAITDHSSSEDVNYRGLGYNFGIGYDLHLSRSSTDLKNWSIQFILERGVSDYDVGGINARGQEGHYGAYANYYFLNNPLTLNSFIALAGIGLKIGSVDMSSEGLTKKYTYQSLCLPAMQLMTKYRFRSGDLKEDSVNVGASLNAGMTLDIKKLSVIDSLDDDINGKFSITDIKYLLGMSFYF